MGESFSAFLKAFLFYLVCCQAEAIVGAIEGPIPLDHPGSYNTVALVRKLNNSSYKIFCSGFVLSQRAIATAKHCIADRSTEKYFIYFGNDTNSIDPTLLYEVANHQVYGSSDWQSFFPSFDVGVVELTTEIPSKFKPIPILTDPHRLQEAQEIYLVGYGNQSPEINEIVAGEKKHVQIGFKEYMDRPQASSLLLFEGQQGHSNCHGDSGGPAYVQLDEQWYAIGTAAGFDLSLTPDSYSKREDEDFPFIARCDRSQTLYSFIGDYAPWLESFAFVNLKSEGSRRSLDPGVFQKNPINGTDFSDWCENLNFQDEGWSTVRHLIIQAVDSQTDYPPREVYLDCSLSEKILQDLDFLEFDEYSPFSSLESLNSLSKLKEVRFIKPQNVPNFSGVKNSSIETIRIEELEGEINLQDLAGIENLKNLTIRNSEQRDLTGLDNLTKIETLLLNKNQIDDLSGLKGLSQLKSLDLASNHVSDLSPLRGLHSLEKLTVLENEIESIPNFMDLKNLKHLDASENDLGSLKFLAHSRQLESLKIRKNKITSLEGILNLEDLQELDLSQNPIESNLKGKWLSQISVLRLNNTGIESLDFLKNSDNLTKLYVGGNNIKSLREISELKNLRVLFAGSNPIDKSEETCPTSGNKVVARLCKKLNSPSLELPPDVRWRFE